MNLRTIFKLLKAAGKEWQEDKVSRLAAALAYYTAFSIAPLLVIAIAITALFFGEEAAQNQIVGQLQGLLGQDGAQAVQTMIENSRKPAQGTIATIISIVILLFGASGVFTQLQDSLNTIWEVTPKPDRGLKGILKDRFLSFGMVIVIAFLLLVSLVIGAVLSVFTNYLGDIVPGLAALWSILDFVISFGVTTALFAMIFRVLPDVEITWKDVAIGAVVTSLLFAIGRSLIGIYLGNSSIGSTYGAAGSFVVLLVWIYYSAQILFFGAELTQVYANKYGSKIVPSPNAMPVTERQRNNEGIPHLSQSESTSHHPHRQSAITLPGMTGIYRRFAKMGRRKSSRRQRRNPNELS